jgi:hypothetical protein
MECTESKCRFRSIILGNGNNDTVSANNSSFDTIILGNGINDVVNAIGSQHHTITLGNGTGDWGGVQWSGKTGRETITIGGNYKRSRSATGLVTR